MKTQSKTSNSNGSKTSRSCDICLHRYAQWFCAADDAFLCQSCDTYVHSANQLASRHERVRLELTTSLKIKEIIKKDDDDDEKSCLVWHHGFTKKPRTRRIHKSKKGLENYSNLAVLVPEISTTSDDQENEEQLLFRVPVLDRFETDDNIISSKDSEFVDLDLLLNINQDIELEELCGFEGLKFEEEAVTDLYYDPGLETASESFNWDFDYSSSPMREEEEMKSEVKMKAKQKRGIINLKLNHEAIICAWDCQTSPWMNGIRPNFNLDDCWHDFMEVGCAFDENIPNGGTNGRRCGGRDEEREARVLRYKEKRRTRLFAKKIRYEVRKLNAEKRPRMKGRFVKRTAFAASSLPCYNKQ